ncbi:MAG: arginine repressor [Oscillospiraceae bacterium]|jgi:transcriptional regulator of arginine metabolism|nr:arginine repressor [Oscillospiraceae bacterium]
MYLRRNKILEIIAREPVGTQKELCEKLEASGFAVTQATVSRDIRQLRLVKAPVGGGAYRYCAENLSDGGLTPRLKTIFRESVISCDIAKNIVVLKTLPGLASAACSALDSMSITGLVGTLAGDDTAFLAMKSDADARELLRAINNILL